jgi:sigma-E factor negative regulatory protein RseC
MHQNIEHPGIISKIENGRIWVTIQPQSACGGCSSKSYCSMSEVAEKVVEVNAKMGKSYLAGEPVTISLQKSLGYRALFLGYLLPFLLVMVTLISLLSITENEAVSAIAAVLIPIPYYAVLYIRRDSIKTPFRFYLK